MASIIFGNYEPRLEKLAPFPDNSDPNIIDVEWLDEKGSPIGVKTINGIQFSDIMYGEKVRVKVKFQNFVDNRNVFISLCASNNNIRAYKPPIPSFKVKNNEALSDPFYLPVTKLYQDEIEEYDYTKHCTMVNKPQELYVTVLVRTTLKSKPNHILKPYTYFRNYEELVGLFKADKSESKHFVDNYENKFIGDDGSIKKIADDFIAKISDVESVSDKTKIDELIRVSAKALWNTAVSSVQSGKPDDRPLYWARNKMEVYLKRHPIFKNDIDFEKSLPKPNTTLSRFITLFEELSRNYTGINFSGAGSKKKVLITGFDPFMINSINHNTYKEDYNIEQSNPSGCVALKLDKVIIGNAYIQTLIVPVRYTDFDSSSIQNLGQGEGIIEKYIGPLISQVDIIITCSQAGEGEYNVDKYTTTRRGGFNDNMDFIRIPGSQCISTSSNKEWIETTLPSSFLNAPQIKYNFNYRDQYTMLKEGNINPPTIGNIMYEGSGGSYLSNEIFYRVAKMRTERLDKKGNTGILPTGHFHIAKLQKPSPNPNVHYSAQKTKDLLNIVEKAIEEGIKGI